MKLQLRSERIVYKRVTARTVRQRDKMEDTKLRNGEEATKREKRSEVAGSYKLDGYISRVN